MSFLVAVVAAVVTVNPLRVWPGGPGRSRSRRVLCAAGAAVMVLAAVMVVSGLSAPVLNALKISVPTARIGAGVALVMIGGRDMIFGPARPEPALAGLKAAMVPMAVPHLFGPGLGVLALSAGADLGVIRAGAAVGLALVVAVAVVAQPPPGRIGARVARAGQVLTGAAAIVVGAGLGADGVFDI